MWCFKKDDGLCYVSRANSHGEIEKHICMFLNKTFSNRNLTASVGCVMFLVFDLKKQKKKPCLYFVITIRDSFSMCFFMHELFCGKVLNLQAELYKNITHKVPAEA